MNLLFKKVLSIIVSVCLIATIVGATVNAKTGKVNVDGQEYEIVENNLNITTVKQNYKGFVISASLNKKTKEVTAEVVENPNNILGIGKSKKNKYKIEVQDMDENGDIKAIAKDVETNQVLRIGYNEAQEDHDKVVAQAPLVLIPIGSVLGALLAWLFAAAATIVILGVTYTLVSDIASEMKNKQYDYYQAKIANGDVWVAGAFSDRASALAYLRASGFNDVFARTDALARSLASSVAGSYQFCTMPHNTDGFYAHYHPYAGGAKLGNHVFFF